MSDLSEYLEKRQCEDCVFAIFGQYEHWWCQRYPQEVRKEGPGQGCGEHISIHAGDEG